MNLDQLARDAGAEVRDQVATIERPGAGVIARRSRRGRMAAGMAVLAVLALAGGGLTVALQDGPAPTRLQVTDDPETTTLPANGWVASFSSIGLERYGATSGPEVVLEGTGMQACPAFSPDGERLMFGREDDGGDGSLEVVSITEDGRASPRSTIPLDGIEDSRPAIPCAIWAPDGRWAALGGGGSVWVVDTEAAEVRQLPVYDAIDIEWRPGTDQLAISGQARPNQSVSSNNPITIYAVSTGEIRTIDVEAAEFSWSPDGSTIAFAQAGPEAGDTRSGISLVDADATNPRTLTTDNWVEQGIGPVWSPRGDQIVYQRERADCAEPACHERSEVVLVTATDDDPRQPIGIERAIPPIPNDFYAEPGRYLGPWYANSITWSPDGTELLYSGVTGLLRVPVDPVGPLIVLSDDPATNLYTDYTTKPWIALQAWQPVPQTTTAEAADDDSSTVAQGEAVEPAERLHPQTVYLDAEEQGGEVIGEFRVNDVVVTLQCSDTDNPIPAETRLVGEVTANPDGRRLRTLHDGNDGKNRRERLRDGDLVALVIRDRGVLYTDDRASSCTELLDLIPDLDGGHFHTIPGSNYTVETGGAGFNP